MTDKQTDVSTVIIINKSQLGTKTLQIKTKHLNNLKNYILGLIVLIISLAGSIFYLRYTNDKKEAEKQQLISQVTKLQALLPPTVPGAKKGNNSQIYIQGIESKLQKINDYLKKRGLPGFSTKSVGGNANADASKLTDEENYSLYNEYLGRLVNAVAFTPMGYPRNSSLTSFFGYRNDPFNSEHAEYHPGLDFRGIKGDEARCTAKGKVIFAGWNGGYGNCVRIAHANNYETLYGHLSHINVRVGQEVTVGEKIGEVGSTGHSTGAHLHYEVRKNGKAVNPINFLSLNK
jgi:murein DD-endopeptidase MepM/ murein hydrolase activator NlpD